VVRSGQGLWRQDSARIGPLTLRPHVCRLRYNLRPEREFRCFVRGGALVGASQRDISQHFPQLSAVAECAGPAPRSAAASPPSSSSSEEEVEGNGGVSSTIAIQLIKQAIAEFHQHIREVLPLQDCSYDVYVASDNLTVKLVDFNAIGGATSPLLFTWAELGLDCRSSGEGSATEQPEARRGGQLAWPLRMIAPGGGMQAGQRAACAMPFDMLNLTDAGQIAALMEQAQSD
jgi:hypothetical protein